MSLALIYVSVSKDQLRKKTSVDYWEWQQAAAEH